VIWNSIASGVLGMAPKRGENGSRGLEVERPVLHLDEHVLAETAVERLELVVRLLDAIDGHVVCYRRTRANITTPLCGASGSASMFAPSACVRL